MFNFSKVPHLPTKVSRAMCHAHFFPVSPERKEEEDRFVCMKSVMESDIVMTGGLRTDSLLMKRLEGNFLGGGV